VAVLVYGTVHSTAMLRVTAPSLARTVMRPLGPWGRAFIHGWCAPACLASQPPATHPPATHLQLGCHSGMARAVLSKHLGPRAAIIRLTGSVPSWPGYEQAQHCASTHERDGGSGWRPTQPEMEKAARSLLSLYQALLSLKEHEASRAGGGEGIFPACVLTRIDSLFLGPDGFEPWAARPWRFPKRLHMPYTWQSFGGVNDRFVYGSTVAVERYVIERLRILHEKRLCWHRAVHSACLVTLRTGLRVAMMAVRFVRLGSTGTVAPVDQAIMLGNASHWKPWMDAHGTMCAGQWHQRFVSTFGHRVEAWPWANATQALNLHFAPPVASGGHVACRPSASTL